MTCRPSGAELYVIWNRLGITVGQIATFDPRSGAAGLTQRRGGRVELVSRC